MIAPVSASCRYCSAQKFIAVMHGSIMARSNCSHGRRVRSRFMRLRGTITAAVITVWPRKRRNTICSSGRLCTSHFADTSRIEKQSTATETMPMPTRRLRPLSRCRRDGAADDGMWAKVTPAKGHVDGPRHVTGMTSPHAQAPRLPKRSSPLLQPSGSGRWLQAPEGRHGNHTLKGSVLIRLPVAAKIAFASAGANGGTPGSPTPVAWTENGCSTIAVWTFSG